MKQLKRRRTMRPPTSHPDPQAAASKLRPPHPTLCHNGLCSVHPPLDAPLHFSDSDKADHLECTHDGLCVSYKGPGQDDKDAATIRADDKDAASIRTVLPIPDHAIALYYFEITILNHGATGRIGVGLCASSVHLSKMPGWEYGSFAYHGDDGMLFRQTGAQGVNYGPKYGNQDVIGCCWDLVNNEVFFTKNGENLGVAFRDVPGPLYPTVGMQSNGAQISANFGASPFQFDLEAFAQRHRHTLLNSITSRPLPKGYRILSDTVLTYLVHNGYTATAAAFAKDAGREHLYRTERDSMLKRQAVCDKVLIGDIDAAIADLERQFPHVLKRHFNVRFLLHTQKFIEMIVSGANLVDIVEYGQKELAVFQKPDIVATAEEQDSAQGGAHTSLSYDTILQDVHVLLAYEDPSRSPTSYLTKQSRRDMVADRLNSAILASQGRPMRSVLERFICQHRNVLAHLLKKTNGPAALVSEDDVA